MLGTCKYREESDLLFVTSEDDREGASDGEYGGANGDDKHDDDGYGMAITTVNMEWH